MALLIILALAFGSWGGAHSQDWNCLGPQPAVTGPCTVRAAPLAAPDPVLRSILEQSDLEFRGVRP